MKAYVAVTDNDLFRVWRSQPGIEEVNFWQPSVSKGFRALTVGEPLLFKLHSPENFIVGGGFFAHFSPLSASLAWQAFGPRNGTNSLNEMRGRIRKYRRRPLAPHEDPEVGCILLQAPFFFDQIDWIPTPKDFRPSIVRGKGYDLATPAGRALWEAVHLRLRATQPLEAGGPQASFYKEPVLIRPSLGTGIFQVMVFDAYRRRCAVTGTRAHPALRPTLIRPTSEGGLHRIDNGLLLRADLQRLFERGYVTVAPDHRVRVSKRLRDDFADVDSYDGIHGREIELPEEPELRPRSEFLEWHSTTVFNG